LFSLKKFKSKEKFNKFCRKKDESPIAISAAENIKKNKLKDKRPTSLVIIENNKEEAYSVIQKSSETISKEKTFNVLTKKIKIKKKNKSDVCKDASKIKKKSPYKIPKHKQSA